MIKRYCRHCGREMVTRQTQEGYDVDTGERVKRDYLECPSRWCRFWNPLIGG